MNKNKRIADLLEVMAYHHNGLARLSTELSEIVLEKESVTSPLKVDFSEPSPAFKASKADHNDFTAAEAVKQFERVKNVLTTGKVDRDSWKDDMTKEINDNNRKLAEGVKAAAALKNEPKFNTLFPGLNQPQATSCVKTVLDPKLKEQIKPLSIGTIVYEGNSSLAVIHQDNRRIFYKIIVGADRGAVITVNKKTRLVTNDGRFSGTIRHGATLATVTKDKDGRDYVNRIIRTRIGKREKIVRFYRPGRPYTWMRKTSPKPFTHCVIRVYLRHERITY